MKRIVLMIVLALAPVATASPKGPGIVLLELDGQIVQTVASATGGFPFGNVITEPPSAPYFLQKRILIPDYEPITLTVSPLMSVALHEWVRESWMLKAQSKSGAIIYADAAGNITGRLEFSHALVLETTVPLLDASSKAPIWLELKLQPEATRYVNGTGKVPTGIFDPPDVRAFRLQIKDLDASSTARTESFTVAAPVSTSSLPHTMSRMNFPSIRFTVPESAAGAFRSYLQSSVVDGVNGSSAEKVGALTMLASDLTTVVLQIDLNHMGIYRVAPEPATTPAAQRWVVDFYVEEMVLRVKGIPLPGDGPIVAPNP